MSQAHNNNMTSTLCYTDASVKNLLVIQPAEETQMINVYGTMRLQCVLQTGAIPLRSISWYKNGNVLDISADSRVAIDRSSKNSSHTAITLVITNAIQNDSGLYSCLATADLSRIVRITVKGIVENTVIKILFKRGLTKQFVLYKFDLDKTPMMV